MLTLEEFRATGQDTKDVGEAVRDLGLEGVPGRVYLASFFIEDIAGCPPGAPAHGRGRWLLPLANQQFQSDDLAELEEKLYRYACKEGACG